LVGVAVGVAGVCIAAAALAIAIANHGGSSNNRSHSSPPTSTAKRQASAVTMLLTSMIRTHQMLQGAVLGIENNCQNLSPRQKSADVAAIRRSAGQRRAEYGQARTLDVTALPSGTAAKSDLIRALSNSLQADDSYLTWAEKEQKGCFVSGGSSAYDAANIFSSRANVAKASFATIWNNQIATKFNKPPVEASNL